MNEAELENQKKQLIEELGVLMERKHKLAPVAARILSTLILTGQGGITFDRLVQSLNASKSTVSTHLDQLQSTNKIKYFTRPGDRKRYFVINPNLTFDVIDEMTAQWETEREVHKKILQYKQERNEILEKEEGTPFDLDFQKDLLEFLNEATTAIQKLKTKLKQRDITNFNS